MLKAGNWINRFYRNLIINIIIKRYKVITEEALAALTVQKNDEKVQAVTALRNEMQAIVDKVSSERDEHLSNYTKVR